MNCCLFRYLGLKSPLIDNEHDNSDWDFRENELLRCIEFRQNETEKLKKEHSDKIHTLKSEISFYTRDMDIQSNYTVV